MLASAIVQIKTVDSGSASNGAASPPAQHTGIHSVGRRARQISVRDLKCPTGIAIVLRRITASNAYTGIVLRGCFCFINEGYPAMPPDLNSRARGQTPQLICLAHRDGAGWRRV